MLADPRTYGAPERIALLGKDKALSEIAKVEERWLEMSTELEAAERAIA